MARFASITPTPCRSSVVPSCSSDASYSGTAAPEVTLRGAAGTELAQRARDLPGLAELLDEREHRRPELARSLEVARRERHHACLAERAGPQRGRDLAGQLDCFVEAAAALLDVPAHPPEVPQRVRETELAADVPDRACVREAGAVVVVVEGDPLEPCGVGVAPPVHVVALDLVEEPVEMTVTYLTLVARRAEQLGRILAHRLEHREARLAAGAFRPRDERRVQQVVERGGNVDPGTDDRLDRVQRRSAAEGRQRGQHRPGLLVEQLHAPVDRGAKRALPLRKIACPA